MADSMEMEHELCANCKKEIPQANYVMHTAHCARNISLCPVCKEPFPKNKLEDHKKRHCNKKVPTVNASTSTRRLNTPVPTVTPKPLPVQKPVTNTPSKPVSNNVPTPVGTYNGAKPRVPTVSNGTAPRPAGDYAAPVKASMLACKYCDLELPKLDLDDHETYCGTRTDKCIECGEFVMFKYKKLHEDSNHGFIKLNDEPGPRPTWDSNTQRSAPAPTEPVYARRSRLPPLRPFDMTTLYDMTDYMPPSATGRLGNNGIKTEKGESYKDISRRLDCKTEYIRNLLHDSASITAPLRNSGTQPRNHFNHNKGSDGPAPQPPYRRRNPPTELTIPCEFCDTPVPHEDLIQHETGCRPDLARLNPRRRSSPDFDDEYFVAQQMRQPSSPEVQLPCEFCADMIPASQLLLHQAKCN